MARPCQICCFLSLLMILSLGDSPAQIDKNHESRAAAALFGQFETVFYSDIGLVAHPDQLSKHKASSLLRPFWLLTSGLKSVGEEFKTAILVNGQSVLGGAREFRPPKGFGLAQSQLCYVVVLQGHNAIHLQKYFQKHGPIATAAGAPVWSWTAELGEFGEQDPRPSTLYATQVADSYLLVSNSLEELRIMAERLWSSEADTKILGAIPGWEFVSKHEMWGYRRFPPGFVDTLSLPKVSPFASGTEAVVVAADWKKKNVTLQVLSSPRDEKSTATRLNELGMFPRMVRITPGVWKTTFSLIGIDERDFDLIYLLGFAVYA